MNEASEREEFARAFSVSYETLAKFDRYAALLTEWQARMNLVASGTLPQIWSRHFFDSAQLLPHIPDAARTLIDIGSGAGFPGLVLALLGARGVHLIEATRKKAAFLRAVADDLNLDVTIHAARAEEIRNLRADIITARALAPLPELLPLCHRFCGKDTTILLLKGAKAPQELTMARKAWHFDLEMIASRTGDSGHLLILRHLHHRQQAARHGKNPYKRNAGRRGK